jgi:hypothetical protein
LTADGDDSEEISRPLEGLHVALVGFDQAHLYTRQMQLDLTTQGANVYYKHVRTA